MAAAAYLLSRVNTIGPRNAAWHVFHTNTTASVDNADFLVADVDKFTTGDIVTAVKVDDLTKVPLGTAVVSGASMHVVVSKSATAVDLSNTLLATYTDAD
jgi:hypothetical protein